MQLRGTVLYALLVPALCSVATTAVEAQAPVARFLPDGTTHWYQVVETPNGIAWSAANRAALAAGGYLATVQTATENAFVFGLVDDAKYWTRNATGQWTGPWLGGVQAVSSSEPAGGWMWGELEPFAYANWTKGEPDDNSSADRIQFGGSTVGRVATWADAPGNQKRKGYVIEFSGATNPRTVGLFRRDPNSRDGYTLIAPGSSKNSFLLDPRGRVVHTWTSQFFPGLAAYLLPDGSLLRAGTVSNPSFLAGGGGGVIEEFDWSGTLTWRFYYSTPTYCHHHDIQKLPNGNVLILAWEIVSKAQAIAAGRDPARVPDSQLWPERIVEVKPTRPNGGTIIWEWHAWDHLVQDFDKTKANFGNVAKHPELLDVNYTMRGNNGADWLHCNAVTYNAKLDQIMISCRALSEVWLIDHSTKTAQARSHTGGRSGKGGDFLYRWGNPAAYRAGTIANQLLFAQHDAHWIPSGMAGAGNILVFNNGNGRPTKFSTVDEFVPPAPDTRGNYPRGAGAWGPTTTKWTYKAPNPGTLWAGFVSGSQRLKNGNTLICEGPKGHSFEVTSAGKIVWDYRNPWGAFGPLEQGAVPSGVMVFRSPRYESTYAAFTGHQLTPGEPIEIFKSAVLLVEGSTASHRAKIGTSVALQLRIPLQAGDQKYYQLATSLTSGVTPLDFRAIRLGVDPLLIASLTNAYPGAFQGYFGKFPSTGRASASIAIPSIPALAGLRLHTAFFIVEPSARSTIAEISNTVVVEIER